MGVKTYDPTQVVVIIGGSIMKTWNTVTVSRDNDRFVMTEGTQGEVTRTKNAGKLGTIVLTNPQASADNTTLSAHELAGSLMACSVIDKGGASVAVMPEGTIMKIPDSEFGEEAGTREWTIKGEIPDPFVAGGNN